MHDCGLGIEVYGLVGTIYSSIILVSSRPDLWQWWRVSISLGLRFEKKLSLIGCGFLIWAAVPVASF